MKIKTRLIGFALVSLLFSFLLGITGVWSGRETNRAIQKNDISTKAMHNHMEADMMHDALRADVLAATLAGLQKKQNERAGIEKELEEHIKNFVNSVKANEMLPLSEDLHLAIATVGPDVNAYIKDSQRLVSLAFDNPEELNVQMPKFLKLFSDLEPRMGALSGRIEQHVDESTSFVTSAANRTEKLLTGLMLAACLCLGALSFMLIGSILGSVAMVRRAIESFNSGDANLQQRLPELDGEFNRLGIALNQFLNSVSLVISRVAASAETIDATTQQVAASNVDLSARTEAQAGSLEQTASPWSN